MYASKLLQYISLSISIDIYVCYGIGLCMSIGKVSIDLLYYSSKYIMSSTCECLYRVSFSSSFVTVLLNCVIIYCTVCLYAALLVRYLAERRFVY